ncbi:MAG: acetate--CoA ligase [Steroidobacterales bacterium]
MTHLYDVPAGFGAQSRFDAKRYTEGYARSIENPEAFWGEVGQRLDWIRPYSRVKNVSFRVEDFRIRWFEDGTLNVAHNCLDRHLQERGERTAIIWEGDQPGQSRRISYRELHTEVCRFANVLKDLGVRKGDRVTIYLPMIPEAAVAMLACARIGAIHSVVFAGFSAESIANRIDDCGSRILITADEGLRGGKKVPLKATVETALTHCVTSTIETVVVVQRTGAAIEWQSGRDLSYSELMARASADCPVEEMGAEDPLFILYTSGSTGKPKGALHTTGGYLVYASYTFESVFDHRDQDVFWCTADIGWITGHSYVLYGPLSIGATTLMFEGVPSYPNPGRFWEVCDRHQVTVFYTAPTAVRALMREGDQWVQQHSRQSLRLLGSVGEPINPEAWEWYHRVIGNSRCPIVDTWWQTETGGILITPLPGATRLKPGSAAQPFFGVQPEIVDANGTSLEGACEGVLLLKDSWPGQMRTVYGDHARFIDTYFRAYPGNYFTGDGARRDEDGYYWITGRVDDVINVSGHRMGTAEVESALVAHPAVAEAAVVGFPHDIKGQGIYAYVTLKAGQVPSEELRGALRKVVREQIGPIATPDAIQWAPGLPKTRSGKIMRRILRKIAANETEQLGDTSALSDPGVVAQLLANRRTVR